MHVSEKCLLIKYLNIFLKCSNWFVVRFNLGNKRKKKKAFVSVNCYRNKARNSKPFRNQSRITPGTGWDTYTIHHTGQGTKF